MKSDQVEAFQQTHNFSILSNFLCLYLWKNSKSSHINKFQNTYKFLLLKNIIILAAILKIFEDDVYHWDVLRRDLYTLNQVIKEMVIEILSSY